jgi:hypothetical protein
MEAARLGKAKHWGLTSFYDDNKAFVRRMLKHVEKNGPTTSRELSTRTEKKGTWWDWDEAKVALEYLFLTGQLMSRGRGTDFARIYDTPERVLTPKILNAPTPTEHEARKQLLVRSAIAQGVATASDLADYYRQKSATVKPLITELVEEGELRVVAVDGWTEKTFVHRGAKLPKQLHATALLSPFDSLVWCRPRNERLPHRDLHAKRKAKVWLLRIAVHGERRNGGPGRLESRPRQLEVVGAQRAYRKRREAVDD